MTALAPWTERHFHFDSPVALYPNILARYRGTPARLEDAVRGLAHAQLTAKPEGKWSVQENAVHLLDVETLFRTRLEEYLSGVESLTPAPYDNRNPAAQERSIESIVAGFRAARDRQVATLEALLPETFARTAWHPRLKVPMRLLDHLLFVAEHDDHHLARIWELRQGM